MNEFYFGEYVDQPNTMGCFRKEDGWYLYNIDEHNCCMLTGPISDEGIEYAAALKTNQTDKLPGGKLSDEDLYSYLHNHQIG